MSGKSLALWSLGIASLVVLFAAAAFLVGSLLHWGRGQLHWTKPGVTAATTISPQGQLFGDVVTAEADLYFNPAMVAESTLKITPDFGQYRILGHQSTLRRLGQAYELVERWQLRCLLAACVGPQGPQPETFRPAQLDYRERAGKKVETRLLWPTDTVIPRVSAQDMKAGFRPDLRLRQASFRRSPTLIGWLLVALALLCAAAVIALLALTASWLRAPTADGGRDAAAQQEEQTPDPTAALERARQILAADDRDRLAVDALAQELAAAGHGEEAEAILRLAWGEERPSGDMLEQEVKKQ